MKQQKFIKDLKAGDIVLAHGARFVVTHNARESQSHRPHSAHLVVAHGPSDCAVVKSKWIDGAIVPGYFGPNNKDWIFQGNLRAGKMTVI